MVHPHYHGAYQQAKHMKQTILFVFHFVSNNKYLGIFYLTEIFNESFNIILYNQKLKLEYKEFLYLFVPVQLLIKMDTLVDMNLFHANVLHQCLID